MGKIGVRRVVEIWMQVTRSGPYIWRLKGVWSTFYHKHAWSWLRKNDAKENINMKNRMWSRPNSTQASELERICIVLAAPIFRVEYNALRRRRQSRRLLHLIDSGRNIVCIAAIWVTGIPITIDVGWATVMRILDSRSSIGSDRSQSRWRGARIKSGKVCLCFLQATVFMPDRDDLLSQAESPPY